MSTTEDRPTRSRADSEERLIVAAAALLGEVGPRSLSVRTIAERAGVNHGLVHHYFGGKDGLLRAAMSRLVETHAEYAATRSKGHPIPAPLGLVDDPAYLRAIVRSVLDDEMELARMEITEGVSVPRNALLHLARTSNLDDIDTTTKARLALGMAMEMGWAALEPFIFAVTGTESTKAKDALRTEARRLQIEHMREMLS